MLSVLPKNETLNNTACVFGGEMTEQYERIPLELCLFKCLMAGAKKDKNTDGSPKWKCNNVEYFKVGDICRFWDGVCEKGLNQQGESDIYQRAPPSMIMFYI
jgi:hypothetical protein